MRPGTISFGELPDDVKRELGMSPRSRTSSKVAALKDVPSSWGMCRKHENAVWVWWPKSAGCALCEGETDMYVQLDDAYYDHPKTLHLVSLLGQEADGYPPKLWTWAVKYAKQGVLKHPDLVEVACRWKGDKGKLHNAMMEAGFIEADGVTLHGWMERTGNDIIRYEEKKSRLREKYRNSSGRFRESSAVSELNGTELNGTKLNGTDKSSPSGLLTSTYIAKNPGIIGTEKCSAIIDFYLSSIPFKEAEAAIWNSRKGQKVWEILEPLRPKNGEQIPTMDEIIKSASRAGGNR